MIDAAYPQTLVLLSAGLRTLGHGLDLEAVQRWLGMTIPAVHVQCLPDDGRGKGELVQAVGASGATRLVLGLCSEIYAVAEVQAQVRQARLDPLGIEVVNLGAAAALAHPQPQATEKAKILLAAAVARARAFAGSTPAQVKLCLTASVSRRSLLQLALPVYRAAPAIDASRCAAELGCQACVQVCPQGALARVDGRIYYDKEKCDPCGLCVTACPRTAIQNPAITPAQVEAEVSTLLDPALGCIQPRGLVFRCQRSPLPQGPWHAGWMPVTLPCVGMAPPSWLLAPLLLGASAVGVLPCRGGCATGQEQVIAGRVAYCQEFLQMLGAPAEMVSLAPALDQPPRGAGNRVAVEAPFDAPATVLLQLAQQYDAPLDAVLDHPYTPLGVVTIQTDVCTGCGRCALACPTGALGFAQREDGVALTFEAPLCTACGQCLPTCPEAEHAAISLARRTDLRCLEQGRTSLYRAELARCIACGAPIAPLAMLKRIEALLGKTYAATMPVLSRYCMDCRRGG